MDRIFTITIQDYKTANEPDLLTESLIEQDIRNTLDYCESDGIVIVKEGAPSITLHADEIDQLRSGRGSVNRDGVNVYYD